MALILASMDLIMGEMIDIPKAIYSIYRFLEKSRWFQNTEKLVTCKIKKACCRLLGLSLGYLYGTYYFLKFLPSGWDIPGRIHAK